MATKSVISTFASRVLVALIGLTTVVITSRFLGAEGRGEVSVITSSIALILVFCEFVGGSALINLSYRRSQKHLLYTAVLWSLLICAIAAAVIIPLQLVPSQYAKHLPVLAFMFSLVTISNALLMGRREVKARNLLSVLQPFIVLATAYFYFKFQHCTDPFSYIKALYAGLTVSIVFAVAVNYRKLSNTENSQFHFDLHIFNSGFLAQAGHFIQFLNYRLSFFVIAAFVGESSLGVYNNAITIAEALWIFGHSLGQMQHIQILNNKQPGFDKKVTLRYLHLCVFITLIMLTVVLLLPTNFWTGLFGNDFDYMRKALLLLSPAVMFFSVSVILNHYLHAKDRFKSIIAINSTGLIA
ncbi:MAG: lipopolysaccharide biosynthesis protein, partial [Bacteroidia bacterium]|nr:lipopolysaccharide biosynthesis protein [Bacteroidia bacterium]